MTITIDVSSEGRQHAVVAVTTDSILTCVATSAPDIYIGGVIPGSPAFNLAPGDSMLAPKGTLSLYLFRRSNIPGGFTGRLELNEAPASGTEER